MQNNFNHLRDLTNFPETACIAGNENLDTNHFSEQVGEMKSLLANANYRSRMEFSQRQAYETGMHYESGTPESPERASAKRGLANINQPLDTMSEPDRKRHGFYLDAGYQLKDLSNTFYDNARVIKAEADRRYDKYYQISPDFTGEALDDAVAEQAMLDSINLDELIKYAFGDGSEYDGPTAYSPTSPGYSPSSPTYADHYQTMLAVPVTSSTLESDYSEASDIASLPDVIGFAQAIDEHYGVRPGTPLPIVIDLTSSDEGNIFTT
jgi:hypothetical protein